MVFMGDLICRCCHQVVDEDPGLYVDVFEHMHESCFHFEFEHPGLPEDEAGPSS